MNFIMDNSYMNAGINCVDLRGLEHGSELSRRQCPACIVFSISKDPKKQGGASWAGGRPDLTNTAFSSSGVLSHWEEGHVLGG